MTLVVLSIGCRDVVSNSSSTAVVELTDESFQMEVVEARQPVLVEFWAPWCRPCLEMQPAIEQLADELGGRVTVCRLNIDEAPDIAASFDVNAPPVVILFRDGEVVKRRSGKQTKSALRELISDAFNVTSPSPQRRFSNMYHLMNVQKRYAKCGQQVAALCDVSLEIESGECLALVGARGSGKTTLLSILGAMLAPTAGDILLDGQPLYQMTLRERARLRRQRFGFVFQTFNLIPYVTALENVQAPMLLCGVPHAEQESRATGLLDRFDLGDRMHHRPSELSVGQQQRVALARTLANDPSIILADEPTGNLDLHTRDMVLATLDGFHREGRTIIVVTHDPAVANRAQRRLSLSSGSIVEDSASVLSKCA